MTRPTPFRTRPEDPIRIPRRAPLFNFAVDAGLLLISLLLLASAFFLGKWVGGSWGIILLLVIVFAIGFFRSVTRGF